jgi:hypothetical protein
MKLTPKALITFFISYLATRIYQIEEVDGPWLDFFPYSDQLLTPRTWAWFAGQRLSRVIFLHGIYLSSQGYYWFFGLLFWLEGIELIDFLLHYNEQLFEIRYFYWTFMKVEYDDFKMLIIAMATGTLLFKK